MATHSINLARKIPWTEKPGGLQSMRSQKSGTQLKRLSTCERSGAEESCEETTWTPNWNQYCRWKWGHEFKKCYKSKTENTVYFSFLRLLQGEGSGNTLQYSCLENPRDRGAWWAAVHRVAQSRTQLKWLSMHAWEKKMATHSSILAWRIPGTEEPDGLLSMGSPRVRHDWSDLAAAATATTYRF